MKIINIVPGFGGTFYCGNCLRDSAYVRSLRQAGHDAITLPVYLPLTMNGNLEQSEIPVFYGAVNIYLKQQFPWLRNMPGWMEHMFNAKWILKYAASKAGSTRAEGLEAMTESMLLGIDGNQATELRQLVDYLKYHEKPDVVHFSNALLLGMAALIKKEVGIPVVCSLQDEDVWIDAMHQNYQDKIWKLLAEKARDVDAFVAVSDFFADLMKTKLSIPDEKIHRIPIGILPGQYEYNQPNTSSPAIGFLSRICEENGFGVLVDAFIRLKSFKEFKSLRLHVTGGRTNDDKAFINKQLSKLRTANSVKDVVFFDDFTADGIKAFLKNITVLSVPVLKGEAFGLYQLEAMAAGIPLVQPNLGAFPEIIQSSGGGVIYHPNTAEALATKLKEVISDKDLLIKMSIAGRKAIEEKFDCTKLTEKMLQVYKSVTLN